MWSYPIAKGFSLLAEGVAEELGCSKDGCKFVKAAVLIGAGVLLAAATADPAGGTASVGDAVADSAISGIFNAL